MVLTDVEVDSLSPKPRKSKRQKMGQHIDPQPFEDADALYNSSSNPDQSRPQPDQTIDNNENGYDIALIPADSSLMTLYEEYPDFDPLMAQIENDDNHDHSEQVPAAIPVEAPSTGNIRPTIPMNKNFDGPLSKSHYRRALFYKDVFDFYELKGEEKHTMENLYENQCEFCQAFYSKDERTKGSRIYKKCCNAGQIRLNVFTKPNPDPKQTSESELQLELKKLELKQLILQLLDFNHPMSKEFMQDIRKVNSSLAFASTILTSHVFTSNQTGPPVIMVHGNIAHKLGSVFGIPSNNYAQYMQTYFYEPPEKGTPVKTFFSDSLSIEMNLLIEKIRNLIKQTNKFYITLKAAIDSYNEIPPANREYYETRILPPKRQLIAISNAHPRVYNEPECAEVSLLAKYDPDNCFANTFKKFVVYLKSGGLQEIPFNDSRYMTLAYPLIHLFGELGWYYSMPGGRDKVSLMNYAQYLLQIRQDRHSPLQQDFLLATGKLFQQYILDIYCCMESERLRFHEENQNTVMVDKYATLKQYLQKKFKEPIGRFVVLNSGFVGSTRWFKEEYCDAMTRVKYLGIPTLFITFTCNPKWDEIVESLRPGQIASDRPDVVARVFEVKFKALLEDLKTKEIFGRCIGFQAVYEWQKRGLPHVHILLWIHPNDAPRTVEQYDRYCSAELPDGRKNPKLLKIVKANMIHGPCGIMNPDCVCMRNNKCTRKFPKQFIEKTRKKENCYPELRRRSPQQGGFTTTIEKNGVSYEVDNGWVVPYNPYLLLRYNAHINVEICNSIKSIKYLHKYIHKGGAKAITEESKVKRMPNGELVYDEIKHYTETRYFGGTEAAHRILSFNVVEHHPSVKRLSFHLPGQQRVTWTEGNEAQALENGESTMLLTFFDAVKREKQNPPDKTLLEYDIKTSRGEQKHIVLPLATELTYTEFPRYFAYEKSIKDKIHQWRRRKDNTGRYTDFDQFARLYWAPPTQEDLFYLRILLEKVKGPTSFEDLRTFNSVCYAGFKEACIARGLIGTDDEWLFCMQEAAEVQTSIPKLRQLFATILHNNFPEKPFELWLKCRDNLSEDFRRQRSSTDFDNNTDLENDYQHALHHINDMLIKLSGGEKSLKDYYLPIPTIAKPKIYNSAFIDFEAVNVERQKSIYEKNYLRMNSEQRILFDAIIRAIVYNLNENGISKNIFIDAPGGTGKTFVLNTVIAYLLAFKIPFISCAYSGIAATLLTEGKTSHSAFKLPLEIIPPVQCRVQSSTIHGRFIEEARVVIIDEAPMMHKEQLEAIDRLCNELAGYVPIGSGHYFGDKLTIISGDFRQTLPILPKESSAGICNILISRSFLWHTFETYSLKRNERVMRLCEGQSEQIKQECEDFAKWILSIGDGNVDKGDEVNIPAKFMFEKHKTLDDLIDWVYPEFIKSNNSSSSNTPGIHEKAILSPLNEYVDELNRATIEKYQSNTEVVTLNSADKLIQSHEPGSHTSKFDDDVITTDFLNSLNFSGVPPHELQLKPGTPVLSLRNLNIGEGLCNGTKMEFIRIHKKYLMICKIIGGKNAGEIVHLPRIKFVINNTAYPFSFTRQQYPVRPAFAMTINKSQGQSLKQVAVYLPTPVFSHGQLYVALSRSGIPANTKVFIDENPDIVETNKHNPDGSGTTMNIVWSQALATSSEY